jgi:hypothetical protein
MFAVTMAAIIATADMTLSVSRRAIKSFDLQLPPEMADSRLMRAGAPFASV